jgi:uncharacterized membrane protein
MAVISKGRRIAMRRIYPLLCLVLLLSLGLSLAVSSAAQAQEPEKLEISSTYPTLHGISGTSFEFTVDLKYEGPEARYFDLFTEPPQGWTASIGPAYGGSEQISRIRLDPEKTYGETIKVALYPPWWENPMPGKYTLILKVGSGKLEESIELAAEVDALYALMLTPATGMYNTKAKAGEDSHVDLTLRNIGTASIENITFSSDRPSGWTVTFNPDKIESLEADKSYPVRVTIRPAAKAIAGDYKTTFGASGQDASGKEVKDEIGDFRMTVSTPTIWGFVGIGIVVLVIVGLAVGFTKLGRR